MVADKEYDIGEDEEHPVIPKVEIKEEIEDWDTIELKPLSPNKRIPQFWGGPEVILRVLAYCNEIAMF